MHNKNMVWVFLADDNPGDVILVREALAAHRIESDLTVVGDGDEALKAVAKICAREENLRPDVVLLDINLPRVDGFTVLAALRGDPGCSSVPVIIVTSSDNAGDRKRAASLGVSHYFRKPSDFDEFLKLGGLIRSVLPAPSALPTQSLNSKPLPRP